MKNRSMLLVTFFTFILCGINIAHAQGTLGQQAYAILENKCLNCHGTGGSFTENLLIANRDQLIAGGSVVPGNPDASQLYLRLITEDVAKRMPLAQPALSDNAIAIIRDWITQGASDWEPGPVTDFITTDMMLDTIQSHLDTLASHERPYARYFTLTHLYNAGETPENLQAYRNALSKLVNSLSWGHDIIKPHPINPSQTLLYIDLRHYEWDEWDTRDDVWKRIEQDYPYTLEFDLETEADRFEKLTQLRQDTGSTVPFIHADWFLATASLPPLYHDILRLPDTDLALEQQLGINVARNIQQSPGIRVARAGIVDSGVSNNNRVVERHTSVYGAYWKSYDFAGSVDAQNIRTHPLSFQHDGGEIVFNLPNGLQAYYISDDKGNRIDKAPTDIVSNPAASDPAVRNGLSCIGCHTEGMKTFEDVMRTTIELTENPNYDKTQALRLYVGQDKMDKLLEQDTEKYQQALVKATGAGFEDIEPVHRAHEVFEQPLDATDAAAALGLKTEAFVQEIQDKQSLQNLGLTALLGGGTINRDAWTAQFADIVAALYSEDSTIDPTPTPTPTPIDVAYIPDKNLLVAIAAALGKPNATTITITEMETLTILIADDAGIRDLTGLEKAIKLQRIELRRNAITDLTPLTGLIRLNNIKLRGNNITDISPLANLKSLDWIGLEETNVTDLSPLSGLVRLKNIEIDNTPVTDLSPLAKLPSLEVISAWDTRGISDFSVLAPARRLKEIKCSGNRDLTTLDALRQLKTLKRLTIGRAGITNIEALSELTQLEMLKLWDNQISDLSPLRNLKNLKILHLSFNLISDLSPLAELTQLNELNLEHNIISDVSPLANLTNLTHLDLRENGIADFSPLESLPLSVSIRRENNITSLSRGGPKIEGPWLWMTAPIEGKSPVDAVRSGIDFLAQISNGTVTETEIATHGAIIANPVGTKSWIPGKISPTSSNNINALVNNIGLGSGDVDNHVAYGSIQLDSPKQQETTMLVGSDDSVKVWLNGTVVHTNAVHRGSDGYQDVFAVTLKQGINVLLVAVYEGGGGWSGFFGFETGTQYTVLPPHDRFSLTTDATDFAVDKTFTIDLKVADVSDLAGWQSDIHFDPAILKVNSVREGNFLKQNSGRTHFRRGTIDNTTGRINGVSSTRTTQGGVDGEGTLLSVTFIIINAGETQVTLHGFAAGTSTGKTITANPTGISVGVKKIAPAYPPYDVNEDGIVNVTDVFLVASALGYVNPDNPRIDVNRDGVVDKHDLIIVAQHLDEETTPQAPLHATLGHDNAGAVQHAIDILKQANDGSQAWQQAIEKLEQLTALLIPEKTTLLANYPNPFNPETWIPYQLAKPADVTISIHAIDGTHIRTLDVGHQPIGIYQARSRAAYWDGKNQLGELVASGLYFYTLTAGDWTATRRMLIVK
ncbi:MAG: leucine-rich repeat domain-containing protein [Candidatus Poribacteria bacterium]|nr:leucine-rich repeat domain-containing protein [Candidatus Poribacteria bacterium]